MLRKIYPALPLLAILIPHLHGPLLAEEPSPVLASYRETVTAAELQGWLVFRQEEDTADREAALAELILMKSLAGEAKRLGIDRKREVELEIELKTGRLATATLRRHLQDTLSVTDEEVEALYQENKDTYTHPRRVRLYNLFKRYPLEATDSDKELVLAKMESLRQRLLTGEDFSKLAEAESDSQSRFRKGLIGNVPAGTFPPAIDEVVMAMQPGEISDILHGTDGLTIFYCEKILDAVVRTEENLRQIFRQILEKRAFDRAWDDLQAALIGDPQYHWQVLDAEPPQPEATLVEFADGRLSTADLEHLLSFGAVPRKPTDLPHETLRRRIENYLFAKISSREVDRRGLADEDLKSRQQWSRRQVLATRALLHHVSADLQPPTEEEARKYWESHREDFVRPAFYDLTAILLPLDGAEERNVYRQGELLVHEIRNGETRFEDTARRLSQHPSAADGGRLGPISRWALPRRFGFNFLRAVLRLQIGEMSDLVAEEESGLWILRLDGIEESRPMTFEEARTGAENKVGTAKARSLQARILEEWTANLEIESVDPAN